MSNQLSKLGSIPGVIAVKETETKILVYVNRPTNQIELPMNESGDKPIELIPPMNG